MAKSRRHVASTIDKLPEEVRELIGRLRQDGHTLDAILAKLQELDVEVSRSALGRHVRGLAEVGEQMRRSREIATALVGRFGEEPDNRLLRLNIELMQGVVMSTITAAAQAGEEGDGEAGSVTFGAEDVMFLSKSLGELARAQKTDTDRMLKLRQELAKDAAKAAETVGKAKGLTTDTVQAITHAILGVA